MLLPRSCLPLFFISTTLAVLINRTIDDAIPDSSGNGVKYTNVPGHAWNIGGQCDACTAGELDTTQVYDKTWHDTTFYPTGPGNDSPNVPLNASFSFNGMCTAIYVFCVLAKAKEHPFGNSDMSFYIDGELSGTFVKEAPGGQGYEYNVPVYVNTSLSPGKHDFLLQNGHVNGTAPSLVLLDSIVYS
ncbi:hypothetical protein K435DRAFT_696225 [Dendrothele bispora CBS 962.96]|uniref:Uncharacterized protein n=1 Tax=Dendrothele bispora (strain CBS 962.96) TaxID=1314807 RepID=A0A4S8KWC4_DENBC|nr:hypothetical protein K435DRAFT_696225 [Dendrothele bispora CBS 962.96]